jgi:hypothetical protein
VKRRRLKPQRLKRAAFVIGAAAVFAAAAGAAETCDSRAAQKNAAWARSAPHAWLADIQHKQDVELARTWCHIFETTGIDRVQKGIDFGRVLFTGEGLHPAVGGIVPGSGFAGGLVYNLERAAAHPALRYSGSVEARGSYNGFWTAGGKFDIWTAGNSPEDRHIHATLDAEHYHLPQIAYFGLGNTSLLANETLFGLAQTTAGGHLDVPLAGGFVLVAGLAGLRNSPAGVPGASLPSVEQKFAPGDTPGLGSDTSYVVAGGGINWIYPVAPRIQGYSSALSTAFRWFHETAGAPYSFRRIDATWLNRYSPPTNVDLGTFSAAVRFVEAYAPAGNSMPFYLQPTIGGNNIDNADMLRSYRDYRFRAPNVLVFQTEYTHTIWGPVAAFGLYDAGKVALQRSDIGVSHMRHSFGAGLVVQMGNLPVFKFYYAWGGHEGTHATYTTNTNNFTFSAPGGVF